MVGVWCQKYRVISVPVGSFAQPRHSHVTDTFVHGGTSCRREPLFIGVLCRPSHEPGTSSSTTSGSNCGHNGYRRTQSWCDRSADCAVGNVKPNGKIAGGCIDWKGAATPTESSRRPMEKLIGKSRLPGSLETHIGGRYNRSLWPFARDPQSSARDPWLPRRRCLVEKDTPDDAPACLFNRAQGRPVGDRRGVGDRRAGRRF